MSNESRKWWQVALLTALNIGGVTVVLLIVASDRFDGDELWKGPSAAIGGTLLIGLAKKFLG